ncbi:16S rRNA (guanine(966)-N(2))-methyltransferase RsmD [Parasphingorhabdus sp. DH2-15]|uniref:16S rRNA (guanine(966)-N(2))-methyltransferase RsmD n=1 Tax=Parasphingorhabdus sp. DH2-15 TaxID=3444112 RepID=UPI003F6826E4
MRIISGEYRGRRISAPKGTDITRPTADRTRETLFSMLTSRLGSFEDLEILDLFAGTGALGLEALSRGAKHCYFVEQDRAAVKQLEANIAHLGAEGKATVRMASVMSIGTAVKTADLVLMDPPYGSNAGAVALDKLNRLGWFAPSTWIAMETGRDENVENIDFEKDAERKVGKAMLHILRPKIAGATVG